MVIILIGSESVKSIDWQNFIRRDSIKIFEKIKSLEGIEQYTNLTEFVLSTNEILDIKYLESLKKLTHLNIHKNNLNSSSNGNNILIR